ncbi:MAG: hypothetical protein HOV83_19510, partial [Catenulispora sp.]|nr:hypothetical protein [Catenulispora sp.]
GLLAKEPAQRPSVASALTLLSSENSTSGMSGGIPVTRELTESAPKPPAHPTVPPHQPSYLVQPPPRRSGLKIGLAVAAVVAVSAGATFAVTELIHSGTSSQANPPVSSSSDGATGPTATAPSTTPSTTPPTNHSTPNGTTGSSSNGLNDLDGETTTPATSATSSRSNGGAKAGCAEASHDLDAFNASNPAANGDKDFQIAADRKLASNLANDAKMATDPAVKAAIQSESDSWKKFADFYAAGDSKGMSDTIPETSKAIAAVNTACFG